MEGEYLEEIWETLKKGVKECETKREVKKDSENIDDGTQIIKGKREKYTRHKK